MMYRSVPGWVVATILAVVAVLAGWLGYLHPERLAFYAFTAAFLPTSWAVLVLASPGPDEPGHEAAERFSGALALAGTLVAVALGTRVASTLGVIDETLVERAVGVSMGCLLVVTGNAIPKILTPVERLRCDPAKVQSLERFAGWSFVVTGAFYTLAWFVLEPTRAAFWSVFVTAACVLTVTARFLLMVARHRA